MRLLQQLAMACVLMAFPQLASAQHLHAADSTTRTTWTLAGQAGVSLGSQTDPSFAWRAGLHRWFSGAASVGFDVGRHRWEGVTARGFTKSLDSIEPFRGLAKGGNELQDLSLALRLHGQRSGTYQAAPVLALGAGVYRQVIRNTPYASISDDPRHDQYRMGVSIAVGGAATRGIAPGAELRFTYVDTHPSPSSYVTLSAALLVNR